jgi:hypothetical protein
MLRYRELNVSRSVREAFYLPGATSNRNSDPELLVEIEAAFAAITHIVIDKPEDVQSLEEIVVVVDEFKREGQVFGGRRGR